MRRKIELSRKEITKKDNHMKYLLPLAIALVFTACNDAKKTEVEANTTAPVEMNTTAPEANTTATATEANTTAPEANTTAPAAK